MHATRLARAPQAVAGPTDHYTGTGTTLQALAVSALPFNFNFTGVSYGIFSRDWVTGSGQACLNMAVTRKSGPGALYGAYFNASLYANGSYAGRNALFPDDGYWYQYCFTGLKNGVTYKFWLGDGSAANYTFWDGTGNVQNHP